MKAFIRLCALAFFPFFIISCSSPPGEPKQELSGDWTVTGGEKAEGTVIRSGVRLPSAVTFPDEGWLTFSCVFTLEEKTAALPETWLVLGKLDFPLEVRVNGVFLHRRGTLPPGNMFVQSSNPTVFLVPSTVWNPEGTNTIELKIFKTGSKLVFPEPLLVAGPSEADFQLGPVLFLNSTLFLIFFGINLLGGCYFMFLWLGRRSQFDQLYFSISTLLIGFYFLCIGSPVPLLPGIAHFSVLKAFLGPAVGFLMLFLLEHYRICNFRWFKILIVAVFAAFSVHLAGAGNMNEMNDRFTLSLIPLELGILFIIVIMGVALFRRLPQAWIMAMGILIGVILASHDVYYQMNGKIPTAWLQGIGFFAIEGSMFLSLAIHSSQMYRKLEITANELAEQKEVLARTNIAFGRFVPRELLGFLGKDTVVEVNLGDQVQKNMTILFSDIRNFTQITETMSPKESFNLLNSYLGRMGPIIRDHGGIIDKYIGDSIMALFPASPVKAVEAALAMRHLLVEYNEGRERAGYFPLDMGIGLHTGPLMLGTIGEHERMDGTVISDAVNTSSRIEGLTKVYRIPIIISQSTLAADPLLADSVPHRYLGIMKVKGKEKGLALYEVLDPNDPLFDAKSGHKDLFEAAVRGLEGIDPASSAPLFRSYREKVPGDTCLEPFLERAGSVPAG